MIDAIWWSVAWAGFAAAAGTGLTVAAIALVRHIRDTDVDFAAGYNALAPQLDH